MKHGYDVVVIAKAADASLRRRLVVAAGEPSVEGAAALGQYFYEWHAAGATEANRLAQKLHVVSVNAIVYIAR